VEAALVTEEAAAVRAMWQHVLGQPVAPAASA
jgi:hypothetical protein